MNLPNLSQEMLAGRLFLWGAFENGQMCGVSAMQNVGHITALYVRPVSYTHLDVYKRQESPYYDWFLIDGAYPVPSRANYECFAECTYMPKLDTANREVQEYLIGIACYWIREYGIDGWRLDVSDEVSHVFWRRFREAVKKEKADAVIIGENWHDAYPYLRGDQYDSIMNYAFTKACLDYFARKTFDAKQMAEKLSSNLMRNMEPRCV